MQILGFDPALNVVHSELDNFHTISGACRIGRGCVTDVTDGLNFTPQTVSFSQFQNRAISKWPGFETGATERALGRTDHVDCTTTYLPLP